LRSSNVLGGTAYTCSFSTRQKYIGVRSGDRGGHAIGPPRPIHLPECVAFNHCRTSSPQWALAPSCWNQNLCLIATGMSSSSRWTVCLSGSRQGSTTEFPTVPAQTLTLTWCASSRISRRLSRARRWVLCTLNTPSRVKDA
jgi:hypothetical protein